MNPRTKNLVMVAGAVLAVGFVGVNTLMPVPQSAATSVVSEEPTNSAIPAATEGTSPDSLEPGIAPSPLASPGAAVALSRRSYAVGLHDLTGFPPDAAPGARLELWVTWEPPLTEEPRLQKLIGDALLERTIPGSIPEAPVTILLSVPEGRVDDLIYADRFGKLSVAVPE